MCLKNGDRILEEIGKTFQKAIAAGALIVRLLGNNGWGKHQSGITATPTMMMGSAETSVRTIGKAICLNGSLDRGPAVMRILKARILKT